MATVIGAKMHHICIVFTAGTCFVKDVGNETTLVFVFFLHSGLAKNVGRADGTEHYGIVNTATIVLVPDARVWEQVAGAKKVLIDHPSSSLQSSLLMQILD